jgi:hypothetical protein
MVKTSPSVKMRSANVFFGFGVLSMAATLNCKITKLLTKSKEALDRCDGLFAGVVRSRSSYPQTVASRQG